MMTRGMTGVVRVIAMAATLAGCVSSGVVPVETRPVGYADKDEGDGLFVVGRSVTGGAPAPQMYVRKTDVRVTQLSEANATGSLYRANDRRNDLYGMGHVADVGEFVTVNVDSNHGEQAPAKATPEGEEAKTGDAKLDEIMANLPDLEPGDKTSRPLTRFKMQVTHRYDNGDVLAMYKRESDSGAERRMIQVQARIPYERMMAGASIRTSDLSDVNWVEANPRETIERVSGGWEDEYTARLSGFDEAKSRVAMELEDKRNALKEARSQIQKQIESLAAERRTMATERENLLKERQRNEAKIVELQAVADSQAAALEVADLGAAKKEVGKTADKVADKAQDVANKTRDNANKVDAKTGGAAAPARK